MRGATASGLHAAGPVLAPGRARRSWASGSPTSFLPLAAGTASSSRSSGLRSPHMGRSPMLLDRGRSASPTRAFLVGATSFTQGSAIGSAAAPVNGCSRAARASWQHAGIGASSPLSATLRPRDQPPQGTALLEQHYASPFHESSWNSSSTDATTVPARRNVYAVAETVSAFGPVLGSPRATTFGAEATLSGPAEPEYSSQELGQGGVAALPEASRPAPLGDSGWYPPSPLLSSFRSPLLSPQLSSLQKTTSTSRPLFGLDSLSPSRVEVPDASRHVPLGWNPFELIPDANDISRDLGAQKGGS